jgi:PhzF family phenazine biosynthesis protein
MRQISIRYVDVFPAAPFKGNPVAVVFAGDELFDAQMQAIASWLNLSETTFVCRPVDSLADYRLRIFTPRMELPFAGHPTIGSAHAILSSGHSPKRAGRLIQECGKGLVEIREDAGRVFFRLPRAVFTPPDSRQLERAAAALDIEKDDICGAAIVDVGAVWLTMQLRDSSVVTNLKPDMAAIAALSHAPLIGLNVFGFHKSGGPAAIEVRSFAPAHGVPEDPVCGSGNGCAAAFIYRNKLIDRSSYVANQGQCVQRDGRVEVRLDGDDIWVGGVAAVRMEGALTLSENYFNEAPMTDRIMPSVLL